MVISRLYASVLIAWRSLGNRFLYSVRKSPIVFEPLLTTCLTRPSPVSPIRSSNGIELAIIGVDGDAIQAIENSRLTGALVLGNNAQAGRVLFNDGQIVGAESGQLIAHDAFRQIVEVTAGTFEFQKAAQSFPVTIESASNTKLILDSLRQVDEEKA